ncbi:MAG: SDR family NAD(P)-dependent oxidoreductase [Halioglobus sp.]
MTKNTSRVSWQGGVAVITGAASGIGEALAREAAVQMGMKLVLADIDETGLERVAADLTGRGCEVLAVMTDVADAASMTRLAEKTLEHFGSVRLLVNNAGIETLGFSWEIPPAQWQKILGVNIHGVVNGVSAFAPAMIASGEPCVIANMSSIAGISIAPIQASYVMSKHAVLAFSECLHLEMQMKSTDVQISAVLPGPVKTQIFESVGELPDPIAAEHRQQMISLLDSNGITAEAAAQTIFHQLSAGNFWVSTHPEMTQMMAEQRARYLSSLDTPSLDVESAFSTDA